MLIFVWLNLQWKKRISKTKPHKKLMREEERERVKCHRISKNCAISDGTSITNCSWTITTTNCKKDYKWQPKKSYFSHELFKQLTFEETDRKSQRVNRNHTNNYLTRQVDDEDISMSRKKKEENMCFSHMSQQVRKMYELLIRSASLLIMRTNNQDYCVWT